MKVIELMQRMEELNERSERFLLESEVVVCIGMDDLSILSVEETEGEVTIYLQREHS